MATPMDKVYIRIMVDLYNGGNNMVFVNPRKLTTISHFHGIFEGFQPFEGDSQWWNSHWQQLCSWVAGQSPRLARSRAPCAGLWADPPPPVSHRTAWREGHWHINIFPYVIYIIQMNVHIYNYIYISIYILYCIMNIRHVYIYMYHIIWRVYVVNIIYNINTTHSADPPRINPSHLSVCQEMGAGRFSILAR